jgi:hypothetical protein
MEHGRYIKGEEKLFGPDSPFEIKWGDHGRYLGKETAKSIDHIVC